MICDEEEKRLERRADSLESNRTYRHYIYSVLVLSNRRRLVSSALNHNSLQVYNSRSVNLDKENESSRLTTYHCLSGSTSQCG